MIAREAVTAIDHNYNVGRKQAVNSAGELRMRTECDRGGQRWHAREVLEPKDYSWMDEITTEVLEYVRDRTVPDIVLPTGENIPRNQSKVQQPSKAELIARHQTRLKLRDTSES